MPKSVQIPFKKKFLCTECKETFEQVDVPRSKYFLLQFPLLMIGFIVIGYSIFILSKAPNRLAEPVGFTIFGFALVLFALAFQIMDNKQMEAQGITLGITKYRDRAEEDRAGSDKFRHPKKVAKKQFTKKPKEDVDTDLPAEEVFVQPNKPRTKVKKPKQRSQPIKKPVKVTKLKKILGNEPEEKRPRKIRRAL